MERKQTLRIGAPKESKEILLRDTMVLDDVISGTEKELREAGKDLRRATIEAKELRETDSDGVGVNWNCRVRG